MDILLAILVMLTAILLACITEALRRHGPAGCADWIAAKLISFSDGYRLGKAEYQRALEHNHGWARGRRG